MEKPQLARKEDEVETRVEKTLVVTYNEVHIIDKEAIR